MQLNKNPDDVEFIDVHYVETDEVYPAMDDTFPPSPNSEPIGGEEILQAQLQDRFCVEIPRKLNEGGQ